MVSARLRPLLFSGLHQCHRGTIASGLAHGPGPLFRRCFADDRQETMAGRALKALSEQKPGAAPEAVPVLVKKPLSLKIKEGLLHYWHGSKLLVYETRISSKLLYKMLQGHKLIRREQRQLRRTVSDMLRLVPFVVIMAIPFLELALPVLLKLFPNMLPSTFEDKATFEDKRTKQLKVKLEMAKFLQDTVEGMAVVNRGPQEATSARDFGEAFRRARLSGTPLSSAEVGALAKRLSDVITLENLPRAQLSSICRYMSIKAFGTDSFLRYQIRSRMAAIRADDALIDQEGVDALTLDELLAACHSRGIRSGGRRSRAKLEAELRQWLDLHLRSEVPSVLLILSRAFAMQEPAMEPEEALQTAILSLPEQVVEEATLAAGELAGDSSEAYRQRLQALEKQEGLIAAELAQERAGGAPDAAGGLTAQELERLSDAIKVMASPNPLTDEQSELAELKEEVAHFKEEASELKEASRDTLEVSRAAHALEGQVERLIAAIDQELRTLEADIGSRLQSIQADEKGQLTVAQLEAVFRAIKSDRFDQQRVTAIIHKFDTDGDGKVFLADILQMAERAEDQEGTGVVLEGAPGGKGPTGK